MTNFFYTEYNAWYALLGLVLSFIIASIAYLPFSKFPYLKKWQSAVLFSLRFLTVFFISLLLLKPVFKITQRQSEKSRLVFAQDNSASILFKDSTDAQNYKQEVVSLLNNKQANFNFLPFEFGQQISQNLSFTFDEKETNMGQVFSLFENELYNENIEALIIASDGLANTGENPIHMAQQMPFPIYTIALGDTQTIQDIAIQSVAHPKEVYKGVNFPIDVDVIANNLQGQKLKIELLNGGELLKVDSTIINQSDFYKKITFITSLEKGGLNALSVRINALEEEKNKSNNSKNFYLNVAKESRKILLVYGAHHPDISVFTEVLNGHPAYQLKTLAIDQFSEDLDNYKGLILHQLPNSHQNNLLLLNQLVKNNTPTLFILGEGTNLSDLNQLAYGLNIEQQDKLFDEAQAAYNSDFFLFETDFDPSFLAALPPLQVPFGSYKINYPNNVLFKQQVGNSVVDKPLIYFGQKEDAKAAFILGEGIWKWYLEEYRVLGNHHFTTNLIIKSVSYLLAHQNKKRLDVEFPLVIYENKFPGIYAKFYNENNQAINSPDLSLTISDTANRTFEYLFNKGASNYELLNISLPEGKYHYSAQLTYGDKLYADSGKFVVDNLNLENYSGGANHNVLQRMSNLSGGKFIPYTKLEHLTALLEAHKNGTEKVHTETSFMGLNHYKSLFLLLFMLLLSEWFLRKYWGY